MGGSASTNLGGTPLIIVSMLLSHNFHLHLEFLDECVYSLMCFGFNKLFGIFTFLDNWISCVLKVDG